MSLTLIYGRLPGIGWHPVTHLAELAAELLDAELVTVPADSHRRHVARIGALRPRARHRRGTCLVVAAQPRQLFSLLQALPAGPRYERVAGWVIDSFWHERIPRGPLWRHYDHLFVADPDDVDPWARATGLPVTALPWGSDVLRLGSSGTVRPVDVQRVGRQPAGWEDDGAVRRLLAERGLAFGARPPAGTDAAANQALLAQAFSRTRFTLSFSNLASPAGYTHPTRDYLTARWTDALAGGAVVAGISPRARAAADLLWPGATLELPSAEPTAEVLDLLEDAVRRWTPQQAGLNHELARRRLDWRWRLQTVTEVLDLDAPLLRAELDQLTRRDAVRAPAWVSDATPRAR